MTSRLLKYMGKMAGENVRAKIPQLELVALARALICMSVNSAGIDQGLKDAQYIFEETFNELAPRIRKMPELRN